MTKIRVVVTGYTGFVGKVLVQRLQASGFEVIGIGRSQKSDGLETYQTNYNDLNFIDEIPKFSYFIHLASSLRYFGDQTELNEANAILAERLYRKVDGKCDKFIHVSSIEAASGYLFSSDTTFGRFERKLYVPKPRSRYGKSKLLAERMIAKSVGDTSIVSLRLGNVYSLQHPSFLSDVIKSTYQKSETSFSVNALLTRTLLPVSNDFVAEAILTEMQCTNEKYKRNVKYVVGTEVSVGNLQYLVKQNSSNLFTKIRKISLVVILLRLLQCKLKKNYGTFPTYLISSGVLRKYRSIPSGYEVYEENTEHQNDQIKKVIKSVVFQDKLNA